jgi:hypothetical protein
VDTGSLTFVDLFWVGHFPFDATTPGEVAGTFGVGYWSEDRGDWACWYEIAFPYEGEAACPDCDFGFDAGPADLGLGYTLAGPGCAAFGVVPEAFDGTLDYSWGYAEDYVVYGDLWTKVLLFQYGGSWTPVIGNPSSATYVTGYAADGTLAFAFPFGSNYYYSY